MLTIKNQVFYNINDLAALWAVKPATIRAYVRAGRLTGAKIGRLLWFSEAEVKRFMTT